MEDYLFTQSFALKYLLTNREIECFIFTKKGLNNNAIAKQMHVSVSTIKKFLESIFLKLEVNSRIEAIEKYYNSAFNEISENINKKFKISISDIIKDD